MVWWGLRSFIPTDLQGYADAASPRATFLASTRETWHNSKQVWWQWRDSIIRVGTGTRLQATRSNLQMPLVKCEEAVTLEIDALTMHLLWNGSTVFYSNMWSNLHIQTGFFVVIISFEQIGPKCPSCCYYLMMHPKKKVSAWNIGHLEENVKSDLQKLYYLASNL